MITIFNLGDLVGKFLGGFRKAHRLFFVYGVIWFRFIHFAFFIIIARQKGGSFLENDYFSWVNMFVFALSNGFATTALMILGVRKVTDPQLINLINFFGGFAITFGISIGSMIAIPLA